jgi:LmbE family N-acetylglucosaminyl deacetylase
MKNLLASIKTIKLTLYNALFISWLTMAVLLSYIFSLHSVLLYDLCLAIVVITASTSLSSYRQHSKRQPYFYQSVSIVILVAIFSGLVGIVGRQLVSEQHNVSIIALNEKIAEAVNQQHTDLLIGDKQRVVPISQQSKTGLIVLPLQSCYTGKDTLGNASWRKNIGTNAFAYLIAYDLGPTDPPLCNLKDLITNYGRPDKKLVVKGTIANPKEAILFFDKSAHNPRSKNTKINFPAAIKPNTLLDLPSPFCASKRTVMNFVAHEDDDLLFMNPAIMNLIKQGICVRTVYLTAGDAGTVGNYYWLSRELGSQAAYDNMDGAIQDQWVSRTIKLSNKAYVTINTPSNNLSMSLVFLQLPDGGVKGQGFKQGKFESLAKLISGSMTNIHSVDGQSVFDKQSLISGLSDLITFYKPSVIYTQANDLTTPESDHSDHIATGILTTDAAKLNRTGTSALLIKYFMGYPINGMNPNLRPADAIDKQQTFLKYAGFDPTICNSNYVCDAQHVYTKYLSREYQTNQ